MARTLGYVDAVRLLGEQNSQVLEVLDRVGSVALLGGAVVAPGLLGLLEAKGDLVRLGHELVRRYRRPATGTSRFTRTRRLRAAHEVLLTPSAADPVEFFHSGPEARSRLLDRFRLMVEPFSALIRGLAVWDGLDDPARGRFEAAVDDVPRRATERFGELRRQLAGQVGEVALWHDEQEHQATRTGLARLERTLAAVATGAVPDQRREALARAHRALLDRPVLASGELPPGLCLPTLGESYLAPGFRAAQVGGRRSTPIASTRWSGHRPRSAGRPSRPTCGCCWT